MGHYHLRMRAARPKLALGMARDDDCNGEVSCRPYGHQPGMTETNQPPRNPGRFNGLLLRSLIKPAAVSTPNPPSIPIQSRHRRRSVDRPTRRAGVGLDTAHRGTVRRPKRALAAVRANGRNAPSSGRRHHRCIGHRRASVPSRRNQLVRIQGAQAQTKEIAGDRTSSRLESPQCLSSPMRSIAAPFLCAAFICAKTFASMARRSCASQLAVPVSDCSVSCTSRRPRRASLT